MSGLSLTERLKIRSIAFEHGRRRALTLALSSPLIKWRYVTTGADQILIVPQELRSADPSFWAELDDDYFGLASEIAELRGASPFRITPPSVAWARELNGFSWLRHLAAADNEDATEAARDLVLDWISLNRMPRGVAFEPAVNARRIMSWITQANLLLDDVDVATYTTVIASLVDQITTLKTTWRNAPDGEPRLTALIALTLADLAVTGNEQPKSEIRHALLHELQRQILPDGGHISRNAGVLAEIVMDLLPLGQCYQARGLAAPAEISAFNKKALAFLRFMRLGDGMLARFNGISIGSPAGLATVLGYCGDDVDAVTSAPNSGYARMARGKTVVLVDVGRPPPLELAIDAQAGVLSFELTHGVTQIFVNGGKPGPAHLDWWPAARATASHNTLVVAETSSSQMLRDPQLESLIGGIPIRGPDRVMSELDDAKTGVQLDARHDGYADRFGLNHRRRLSLTADGERFEGIDRIEQAFSQRGVPAPLPYAVHFHCHPDCVVRIDKDKPLATIETVDGDVWQFEAPGATLSLEDSIYFVDSAGPRPAVQIVLRGTTLGNTDIAWSLARQTVAADA